MRNAFNNLNPLRSQKESGASFDFTDAVYTIIPKEKYCQNLHNL